MSASIEPSSDPTNSSKILLYSFLAALLFEGAAVIAVGISQTFWNHPHPVSDANQFIETDVVQLPDEAPKLMTQEPVAKAVPEETVSKVPNQGKVVPNHSDSQSNVTQSAPPLPPSHGPVVYESPAPKIPEYLKNQDLKTNVVIEFLVKSSGESEPRLLSSSGNDELDQIALASARQWKFRPAEDNHKAIDAKIRLRIVFEVH